MNCPMHGVQPRLVCMKMTLQAKIPCLRAAPDGNEISFEAVAQPIIGGPAGQNLPENVFRK